MAGPAGTATRAGPLVRGLAVAPLVAAINHVLEQAAWARTRLQQHDGKCVRVDLPLFAVALLILPTGEIADGAHVEPCDVAVELDPTLALRFLAQDTSAWQQVPVHGDTAFARDLLYVAQNLRWDVEEDLSRVIGDIAAHRLVGAATSFMEWQRHTAANFARSTVAYWTDERPVLVPRRDIEHYLRDVDALQDDVARIEKRIERLLTSAAT